MKLCLQFFSWCLKFQIEMIIEQDLPNMVVLDSELNLICRTWFLLNSLYSKMSFWRSLSQNCSKLCPFIVCIGSSPFIFTTSAWMPSQVTLQLKVLSNFFSMQSLPFGLHFFRSCCCNYLVYIFVNTCLYHYTCIPDIGQFFHKPGFWLHFFRAKSVKFNQMYIYSPTCASF